MPKAEHRPTEPTADAIAGIDLVVFSAGGLRCAIEARRVRSIANADEDGALAITQLLGLTSSPNTRQRLIRLRGSVPTLGPSPLLRVEEPILLHYAPAHELYPLPTLILSLTTLRCLCGVVRIAGTHDDLALLIDPLRLGDRARQADDQAAARGQRVAP